MFYFFLILLTVLNIFPIWSFKYFPSQDGPCHIENSYMLLHYFDKDKIFSEYYDLNIKPVPNWASHFTLSFLMIFFPPVLSEKIFLTMYVLIFISCLLYFLKSFG